MNPPQPLTLTPVDIPALKPAALNSVNTLFRKLVNGLANGLTLAENLSVTFPTLTVIAGVPEPEYIVTTGLGQRCTGLMVWNSVASKDGYGVTVGTNTARWQDLGDGTISVKGLGTFTNDSDYLVTLLCWGEPI